MASSEFTIQRGKALVSHHLDSSWSFAMDHARTRLGCCHYSQKRITCSVYLIAYLADDEVEQVILHEIAHALVGEEVGHGRVWLQTARALGYEGGRTIDVPEARLSARWRGVCVKGHEVFRHRKPRTRCWCAPCSHKGRRKEIRWEDRGLSLLARG